MDAQEVLDGLVQPARLWSRAELLARPSPVPSHPGVYGWYFSELPWPLDTSQCVAWDDCTLLYGASPPRPHPPTAGQRASGRCGTGSVTTTAATPPARPYG